MTNNTAMNNTVSKIVLGLFLFLLFSTKTQAQRPDLLFEQQYPFEWTYAGTHSLEIVDEEGETGCYFVAACDLNTIGYVTGTKGLLKRDDVFTGAGDVEQDTIGRVG